MYLQLTLISIISSLLISVSSWKMPTAYPLLYYIFICAYYWAAILYEHTYFLTSKKKKNYIKATELSL